ncbi:hypothetical protein BJY00DRAFT_314565 [Aspergillus carlsbadensis]|nr:hypothetical protein BJY00DRAFT_314565 [Aspergillus carlsbadensis]
MPDYVPPDQDTFILGSGMGDLVAQVGLNQLPARPDTGGPEWGLFNGPIGDISAGGIVWRTRSAPDYEFYLESCGPNPRCLVASPEEFNPRLVAVTENNTKHDGDKDACKRIVNVQYQDKCITSGREGVMLDHDRATADQQWDLRRPPAW